MYYVCCRWQQQHQKEEKKKKKIKSKDFICSACSMLIRADKPKGLWAWPLCVCANVFVCVNYIHIRATILYNNE